MSWTIVEDASGWTAPRLREEVLEFHAKTNWVLGNEGTILRPDQVKVTNVPDEVSTLAAYRDHPLSPLPLREEALQPCANLSPLRAPTAKSFCPRATMTEAEVSTLLGSSFGQLDGGRRPYPSAGALYPAGVIFIGFEGRMAEPRLTGAFHYRPSTHRLERIGDGHSNALRRAIFGENQRPGFHHGAYVVLAAYEGRADATIRYSVGCAAAFTPDRALAKALAELHQGYMFFEFHGRAGDGNRFAADNTVDTWRHFEFLNQPADKDLVAFMCAPPGGRQPLLQALGNIGPNLHCYIGAGETDRSIVAFFKVVSPDFLLTTRIGTAANLDNRFFKSVGLDRPIPRHIPFY